MTLEGIDPARDRLVCHGPLGELAQVRGQRLDPATDRLVD